MKLKKLCFLIAVASISSIAFANETNDEQSTPSEPSIHKKSKLLKSVDMPAGPLVTTLCAGQTPNLCTHAKKRAIYLKKYMLKFAQVCDPKTIDLEVETTTNPATTTTYKTYTFLICKKLTESDLKLYKLKSKISFPKKSSAVWDEINMLNPRGGTTSESSILDNLPTGVDLFNLTAAQRAANRKSDFNLYHYDTTERKWEKLDLGDSSDKTHNITCTADAVSYGLCGTVGAKVKYNTFLGSRLSFGSFLPLLPADPADPGKAPTPRTVPTDKKALKNYKTLIDAIVDTNTDFLNTELSALTMGEQLGTKSYTEFMLVNTYMGGAPVDPNMLKNTIHILFLQGIGLN